MAEPVKPVDLDDDNPDRRTQFMIKSVLVRARKLAAESARKAGLPMGEWIEKAIYTQVRADAGENVFPPNVPIMPGRETQRRPDPVPIDFAGVAALLGEMRVSAADGDWKVPEATLRNVNATLNAAMRAGRGLPPPKIAGPKPSKTVDHNDHKTTLLSPSRKPIAIKD